jgi:FAD binding domain/Berberine and berberine like
MKTECLVLPHDPGWDEARRAWNLAVDQWPVAVALPESVEDVIAVVRWARSRGLRIAPQTTGHSAGAMGSLAHTVLVKMERMRGVEIDAVNRRARVAAGAVWAEVTDAAAEHGLAALAGSSHDVGVVGYALGGGISHLSRKHGLASSTVEAVELVNAKGEHVRVEAESDPELFWALRGGGGSFGIVTAIEFALLPLEEVFAGVLFFPIERGAEVLHAWRRWVDDVPEELTSIGRFLQFPPIPDIPQPLRGNSFVVIEATYIGDEQAGADLLRPLRELGPVMDTFATIPVEHLRKLHMDPPGPVPGYGDGMLLDDLPEYAIDTLVAVAGAESGSPLISVEVRHLGGALARRAPGHGALASIEADFALFAVGMAPTPELGAAVKARVELVRAAMSQWDAGRAYLNFTERREGGEQLFGPVTYRRLQAVKARVDPDDFVRSNHPVRPDAKLLKKAA